MAVCRLRARPGPTQEAAYSLLNPVKHTLTQGIALALLWQVFSGHREPFLIFLGSVSVVLSVILASRMRITDEEGTPFHMGPGLAGYTLWLTREIVKANVKVARIILGPRLLIRPRLISVPVHPTTELGRVILANSITMTPGTVAVDLRAGRIRVHTLAFKGTEEELIGDMDRRIRSLEG